MWDCFSEIGCQEACAANVTAAVDEANAQCAAQLSTLQDRVEGLEADLNGINETCVECEEVNDNVENLIEILSFEEIQKWQDVVDSGGSCSLVSHNFCVQISGCDMVDGECVDLTTRQPTFSSPSQAPVRCGPDVEPWQAVVDNGTACFFVPLDTCGFITQCQLSANQDICENRQ